MFFSKEEKKPVEFFLRVPHIEHTNVLQNGASSSVYASNRGE